MSRILLALLLALGAWPVSARADELYVTNTHSGTISVIDTARDEVVATVAVTGGSTQPAIALNMATKPPARMSGHTLARPGRSRESPRARASRARSSG